jgi:HAD superfamily phosphatase
MSDLFIKQELLKTLPTLDAVLLDVDGVLLDVSESYRVVISQTAQYFAVQVLGLQETGEILSSADTELFKLAGGFNSDWDLTTSAVALIVAKRFRGDLSDTQSIRAAAPSWESFTSEIKRRGGGPQIAETLILEMLTPRQRRDFANAFKPKLVVQIFQEMYAGDEACRALYGFEPQYLHGEGLYQNERVLIDKTLLASLPSRVKLGLLTGRTRTETQLAMRIAGLQIPESSWVVEDDGVKKPDGRAMLLLQEKMNFKYGVYIGDTMDDLNAVKNYRETKGSGRARVVSCIALSGPSGEAHRRLFLEAGAEIAAPDANTFLEYLNAILK